MLTNAAIAIGPGQPFEIDTVEIDAPRSNEVLVRIAACGICHTDLAVREGHLPMALPAVLGHEGAGEVLAVGDAVSKVSVGDRVALSFASCGECAMCQAGQPAYCSQFNLLNGAGCRTDGSCTHHRLGKPISGMFFGQSSFAGLALAYERNVVKIPDDVPFEVAAPFGCGIQTGAGAVLNSLDCQPGSSLLILGGGTVGLAAALAGLVRGCDPIIVSEPSPMRRQLAVDLGITHALDPAAGPLEGQLRSLMPAGIDHVVDTTGIPGVIESAVQCLAVRGSIGLMGIPADPAWAISANILAVISRGVTIKGVVEGDSDPDTFIPHLIELYRAGRFPIDRLIRTYPLEGINEAIDDQYAGKVVKPVLVLRR